MSFIPERYCGDGMMEEHLRRAGAKIPVPAVYGLMYGVHAAPQMTTPSECFAVIFGDERPFFDSKETAREVMGNLLHLWITLAGVDSGDGVVRLPRMEYPETLEGLKRHIDDNLLLAEQFIKGLALGETEKRHFSKDGARAMESITRISDHLRAFRRGIEREGVVIEEASALMVKVREALAEEIAAAISGLKRARRRGMEEIRRLVDEQLRLWQREGIAVGG